MTSHANAEERIQEFLACTRFVVAGASNDRAKYGNKILRCYLQHGLDVAVVHPKESEIEGVRAYRRLADVPGSPQALSIVTPPRITEALIEEAAAAEIRHVWMQPGAESPEAVARGEALGASVIHGGPCLLVALGFHDR